MYIDVFILTNSNPSALKVLQNDTLVNTEIILFGGLTKFGLIIAADSRTSPGVDYVSNAQRLFDLSLPYD